MVLQMLLSLEDPLSAAPPSYLSTALPCRQTHFRVRPTSSAGAAGKPSFKMNCLGGTSPLFFKVITLGPWSFPTSLNHPPEFPSPIHGGPLASVSPAFLPGDTKSPMTPAGDFQSPPQLAYFQECSLHLPSGPKESGGKGGSTGRQKLLLSWAKWWLGRSLTTMHMSDLEDNVHAWSL